MGTFIPSDTVRILLVDPDGLPYALGFGGTGMFVPSNTARALLVDENGIPYKASGGSGSVFIGQLVTGGTPTDILFIDPFGNLAQSANLTFDGTKLTVNKLQVNGVAEVDGSLIVSPAALATNAIDGFLYIPTSPGQPTGVPTNYNGRAPIEYDTLNNDLYIYYAGAWHKVHLTAVSTIGGEYFADRYFTPNYWTHDYFN
jgi:hypothetical protein